MELNDLLAKESLSDVQQVLLINAAAGNKPPQADGFELQVMRQTKIDLLECLELLQAVALGDTQELRDALADKRVTLNGFSTVLPISLSGDFLQTVENLFTRFDGTEENAKLTQEKYAKLGVETYVAVTELLDQDGLSKKFYATKVKDTVVGADGETYPADKFLKSINFKKDNFEPIQNMSLNPELKIDRWNIIKTMLTSFIVDMDKKIMDNI